MIKGIENIDLSSVRINRVKRAVYKQERAWGMSKDVAEWFTILIKRPSNPNKEIVIGEVTTWIYGNGVKYVAWIKLRPEFRGKGIGTAVIKKYFRGYYIDAGNKRAANLYAKLGRGFDKFNKQERNSYNSALQSKFGTFRFN